MPRKGRTLEVMIKSLENLLSPQGIVVSSPEEFYDEEGKKIGEIDITLRGNFGSSKVFVGIECRDRSASGPQGRDWIREIKGKRDDLKVDKMIAVSTTGFTDPAITLADRWRIDLLTVEDIKKLDIPDWFQLVDFCWTEECYEITGAVELTTIPKTVPKTGHGMLYLRLADTGELLPLKKYIQPELDNHFFSLQASANISQEIKLTLEIDGPIDAVWNGNTLVVSKIKIPIKIWLEAICTRALLNACIRQSDDEVVGLIGICRVKTASRKFSAIVTVKRNPTDNSSRDLKFEFLDDNFEPYEIPAGTKITLLGRQKLE